MMGGLMVVLGLGWVGLMGDVMWRYCFYMLRLRSA
jgi:hypothetical protein